VQWNPRGLTWCAPQPLSAPPGFLQNPQRLLEQALPSFGARPAPGAATTARPAGPPRQGQGGARPGEERGHLWALPWFFSALASGWSRTMRIASS